MPALTFTLLIRNPTTLGWFINYRKCSKSSFFGISAIVENKIRGFKPGKGYNYLPQKPFPPPPPPSPEVKLHTFVFYLHKAISVFYLAVSLSLDGGC